MCVIHVVSLTGRNQNSFFQLAYKTESLSTTVNGSLPFTFSSHLMIYTRLKRQMSEKLDVGIVLNEQIITYN